MEEQPITGMDSGSPPLGPREHYVLARRGLRPERIFWFRTLCRSTKASFLAFLECTGFFLWPSALRLANLGGEGSSDVECAILVKKKHRSSLIAVAFGVLEPSR